MNNLILSGFFVILGNVYCTNKHDPTVTEYFEGSVTYEGSFIKKTDKYDSVVLAAIAGGKTTLYIKEGNFLSTTESGITTRLLYRKEENKFYRERFNSDSVYWTKADKPGSNILRFTKTPKVEKILSIDCDELKVYYENRTVTHYFNPDTLRTNPDWSKNRTSYNEDFYSREMRTISLKTVIEYEDFTIIHTATKITYQKLSKELFDIPKKTLVEDK